MQKKDSSTIPGPGSSECAYERPSFKTIKALFAAMPSGLNPEAADGMDAVFQFHLTGSETMDGRASYHKSAPKLDYSMAVA